MSPRSLITSSIVGVLAIGLVVLAFFFFTPDKDEPETDVLQNNEFPISGNVPAPVAGEAPDIDEKYEQIFAEYRAHEIALQEVTATDEAYGDLYKLSLGNEEFSPESAVTFGAAFEDLNGDGTQEAVVMLDTPDFCGNAGCPLAIYKKRDGEWALIFSGLTDSKVGILPERTGSHYDLLLSIHGDVGYQTRLVRFVWDGALYRESGEVAKWNGQTFVPTRQ